MNCTTKIFYILVSLSLSLSFISIIPSPILLYNSFNCPSVDNTFNCTIIDFLSDSNYYCFTFRKYYSDNHNTSGYGEGTHCNSGYRPKYDCPFDTICYHKYSTDIYDSYIINKCYTIHILLYISIAIFFLSLLSLILFGVYYKK